MKSQEQNKTKLHCSNSRTNQNLEKLESRLIMYLAHWHQSSKISNYSSALIAEAASNFRKNHRNFIQNSNFEAQIKLKVGKRLLWNIMILIKPQFIH